MPELERFVGYKAWADELIYSAVAKLPLDAITAPRPIVFGSILRTLNHVYAMDQVWRAHLEGRAHGFTTRNPPDCPSFASLRSQQQDIDSWYTSYAHSLTASQRAQSVEFEFIGGGAGSMTRADILLHVVNHTTCHRGHIGDMFYNLSATPPTTDLPVYLSQ